MEVRYSFTAQFIRGGAIFANHAHNIEGNSLTKSDEASEAEHRSYVVSTVIQCAAALESEVAISYNRLQNLSIRSRPFIDTN
jgi:hypothetical protein